SFAWARWQLVGRPWSGAISVPLIWPFLATTIIAAGFWLLLRHTTKTGARIIRRVWVRRSWSARTCIIASLPIFVTALLFLPTLLEWLAAGLLGQVYYLTGLREDLGLSEQAFYGLQLTVWLVSTYAV